jgi:predicted dehydrogenase
MWPGGQVARARCSFVEAEQQRLEFIGTSGSLTLDGDAHTGGKQATMIQHLDSAGAHQIYVEPDDPYRRMIDAFAAAVRGTQPWPRPVESSIEMQELLGKIREAAQ